MGVGHLGRSCLATRRVEEVLNDTLEPAIILLHKMMERIVLGIQSSWRSATPALVLVSFALGRSAISENFAFLGPALLI